MKKDILDKLELKNTENLSSNIISSNPVETMSKSLEDLKINDDFSNEEFVEDEFGIIESNSYIDIPESLDEK